MLKEYLAFNRADRIAAVGRVILAVPTLGAALVDPPQPLAFANYVIWLLGAYSAVSVVVLAAVWTRSLSAKPIGQWAHGLDMIVFAALIYLTQGAASPFFALYIFAILSATLRWDWRGALGTSAVIILVFIPTAIVDPGGLDPANDEILRFSVRIGQIVVIGGLLTFIGLQRQRYWQELLWLARPVDARMQSIPKVIDNCLAHVCDFFAVPTALLVWEMRGEPGWQVVRWGNGEALPLLPGPGWQGPVSSDIAGSTFDFRSGAASCRRYASDGQLLTVPYALLDPALAAGWGVKEAVIASIDSDALSGWLVIPKRTTEADLYLARALSVQLAAALDNAAAAETWRTAAASEERVRVAHDLHDGILQFLTGLALQLRLIERQVGSDPEAVTQRVRTVAAALREEQKDLRRLLEDIRPRRGPDATTGQPLSALITALGVQWDIRIDATIASEPPADLADEVRLITREAVANAVRHGKAQLVTISSRIDAAGYHLSISDNGSGIGAAGQYSIAMLRDNGVGPRSILDRIERQNATLVLDTSAVGTSLQMAFPPDRTLGQ